MTDALTRIGRALIAAGNELAGGASFSPPPGSNTPGSPPETKETTTEEVVVTSARAPLRSAPNKEMDPDLGRLVKNEKVPLLEVKVLGNRTWYRIFVLNFAGGDTEIPAGTKEAWAEASRFALVK